MVVEQIKEADSVTLVFEAEIDDIRYPLFKLMISSDLEQCVATMSGENGQQYGIQVIPDEIGDYETLTAEQKNRLYAMQEEINFILENLK
jgi:hypothetical protein